MDTSHLPKVVRDGKVAVLYSPGFGAGWYTWNEDSPACLFDPEIVAILEDSALSTRERTEKISELAEARWSTDTRFFYTGGARDLVIGWITQGHGFEIREYDGSESLRLVGEIDFIIA